MGWGQGESQLISSTSCASAMNCHCLPVLSPCQALKRPFYAQQAAAAAKEALADNTVQVTLQVPVFEPQSASMRQYCATFDPNPPAPAPLTVDRCMDIELGAEATGVNSSLTNSTDPAIDVIHNHEDCLWDFYQISSSRSRQTYGSPVR